MLICPRCAAHLQPGSAACPTCGAVPLASFQQEQDPAAQPSPPDFTPRIRVRDVRSTLAQRAGAWGCLAGVGVCVLAAVVHGGSFGEILLYGCMLLALVAPCAALLGLLFFSVIAEAGQVLIRPLLHALDPKAREALRAIKEGEEGQSVPDAARQSDAGILGQDGLTNEAAPQPQPSENIFQSDAADTRLRGFDPEL